MQDISMQDSYVKHAYVDMQNICKQIKTIYNKEKIQTMTLCDFNMLQMLLIYVDMLEKYINMQLVYVVMRDKNVDMQENRLTCNQFMLTCNIFMLT